MTLLKRLRRIELALLGMAAALLLANAYLTWSYREALAEQVTVETQVLRRETESRRAREAQQQVDRLKEELDSVQSQLSLPPELSFPKTVPSVEATQLALDALARSGFELSTLAFQGASAARIGTRDYQAYRYTLKARGRLDQMSPFLFQVEEGGFSTLIIRNITVTPADKSWDFNAEITIYAQQ